MFFIKYAEGPLLDGLYWEKYYNGQNVSKDHEGYIYFENKILGRPRLRQVRVRNDSCVYVCFLLFLHSYQFYLVKCTNMVWKIDGKCCIF